MLELGPAARGLIESAAAAQMASDAVEATLLLKRLGAGIPLVELAPPEVRVELAKLLDTIRTRAGNAFLAWVERQDMPEAEMRAGLAAYERCATNEMPRVMRDLTPEATSSGTLEKAVKSAIARCDDLVEDLIARDIGWALVGSALAAAEAYAEPLQRLAWRIPR
jgi:hypothetical protein